MQNNQIGSGGQGEPGAAAAAAGIGHDGSTDYSDAFSEQTLAGYQYGTHAVISILFVTPEAVASINTSNAIILLELEKMGNVDHIVQTDALTYPHFAEYNMIVLGSDIGTAWTTSNLAHVKEFPEPGRQLTRPVGCNKQVGVIPGKIQKAPDCGQGQGVGQMYILDDVTDLVLVYPLTDELGD